MATKTGTINDVEKFKDEIRRSLIIDEKEKDFWISRAERLPSEIFNRVYAQVLEKNRVIDGYMEAALAEDSEGKAMHELKTIIAEIKKESFRLEELSEKQTVDDYLNQNLEL